VGFLLDDGYALSTIAMVMGASAFIAAIILLCVNTENSAA
jgi:hypothetical protein